VLPTGHVHVSFEKRRIEWTAPEALAILKHVVQEHEALSESV